MICVPEQRHIIESAEAFGRVAVLMGGWSAEREISLMTGKAVLESLKSSGVDAHGIDLRPGRLDELLDARFDRVWTALHGRGGEDGSIQGALECLGIAYTGSGVAGSAICMDKLRSKQLLATAGIATPDFEILCSEADLDGVVDRLGLPLIAKPAGEGSSVGMAKVETAGELAGAWRAAAQLDNVVLVEKWLDGPEYTASILAGDALPLIRIEAAGTFYDYEAKYFSDRTRYHCPCDLDPVTEKAWRALALAAFETLGASGWGRADFLVAPDGQPSFLEVNTIPGMTSHSLVPMAARAIGIDFDELVWRVLETSFVNEKRMAARG